MQDVWDLNWADDDPSGLAVMSKAKLIIMQGLEPEPPTMTQQYLVSFDKLEATLADMDAVMKVPEVRDAFVLFGLEFCRPKRGRNAETDACAEAFARRRTLAASLHTRYAGT